MIQFGDHNPLMMLVCAERVVYNGLLGRLRPRRLGAFTLYVACGGTLDLTEGARTLRDRRIACVPAHAPHRIAAASGAVTAVLIEPETVTDADLADLAARVADPEAGPHLAARISALRGRLGERFGAGFTAEALDRALFGRPLAPRPMDPRIAAALRALRDPAPEAPVSAADGARLAGLSASRFLHLFKRETGVRFSALRMWKRARSVLVHANREVNLTHLALDLGYPDSTYFSHSIRSIYGMRPRAMFAGSRNLAILRGADAPTA